MISTFIPYTWSLVTYHVCFLFYIYINKHGAPTTSFPTTYISPLLISLIWIHFLTLHLYITPPHTLQSYYIPHTSPHNSLTHFLHTHHPLSHMYTHLLPFSTITLPHTNSPKTCTQQHTYPPTITLTLITILLITQTSYNTSPTHNPQLQPSHQNSHKTYPCQLPTQQPHKSSITSPYHNYTLQTLHPTQHIPQQSHTPNIPHIQTITHIGHFYYITHAQLHSPKYKQIHYYTWNNATLILLSGDIEKQPGPLTQLTQQLLLQCGDIHPNPGPMPDLLNTHPLTTKDIKRHTSYRVQSNSNQNTNTWPKHFNLFLKPRTRYMYIHNPRFHIYTTTYKHA